MYKIRHVDRVIQVSDYGFEKYVKYYSNNDILEVIDKLFIYKGYYEKFLTYKKSEKDYHISINGINKKREGLSVNEVKKIFYETGSNQGDPKLKKIKKRGLP